MSGEGGGEFKRKRGIYQSLEASIKAQHFVKPLQITVRAKADTHGGEPIVSATCVKAVGVQLAVIE